MGRRLAYPDPELIWAALSPGDRAAVDRWVEVLGVDTWTDIPPLRTLLPLVAIQYIAGSMPDDELGATDRFLYAAEALGLEDDPGRATHPADGFARTLRRWIADAGGQNVQPGKDAAA